MLRQRLRSLAKRLLKQERSPHKLALTCSLGAFIAISPLMGGHTLMTFILSRLMRLSVPAVFLVSFSINNPWTMLPIYSFNHLFGKWLFEWLSIDHTRLEPAWLESCYLFIKQHTGISGLSVSALLVGGHILALSVSLVAYMPMKKIFQRITVKKK
jgi:uncharacterized protein (DUF2062 family)